MNFAKAVGFALEIEKKNFSKSKSTIGFQVLVVKLCLLIRLSDIFLILFNWCLKGKSLKISGKKLKKFFQEFGGKNKVKLFQRVQKILVREILLGSVDKRCHVICWVEQAS